MANQIYQFTMNFGNASTPPSLTTQFWNNSATPPGWQTYVEPNFNNGVVRAGGPGGPGNNNGNYAVASTGDTLLINLVGPAGWSWPAETLLQVIISPANSPNANQGFTPFPTVYYPLAGTMQSDNVTMQFSVPDAVQVAPGRNNYYRFELTIAFRACAPNSTTPVYFADDPEMDVMGGN